MSDSSDDDPLDLKAGVFVPADAATIKKLDLLIGVHYGGYLDTRLNGFSKNCKDIKIFKYHPGK